MKRILFLLLLVTSMAHGQEDTTKYLKNPTSYGPQYPRIWATKILRTPYGPLVSINPQPGAIQAGTDGFPYWWNGVSWNKMGSAADLTAYVKYIDTASMLSPYLRSAYAAMIYATKEELNSITFEQAIINGNLLTQPHNIDAQRNAIGFENLDDFYLVSLNDNVSPYSSFNFTNTGLLSNLAYQSGAHVINSQYGIYSYSNNFPIQSHFIGLDTNAVYLDLPVSGIVGPLHGQRRVYLGSDPSSDTPDSIPVYDIVDKNRIVKAAFSNITSGFVTLNTFQTITKPKIVQVSMSPTTDSSIFKIKGTITAGADNITQYGLRVNPTMSPGGHSGVNSWSAYFGGAPVIVDTNLSVSGIVKTRGIRILAGLSDTYLHYLQFYDSVGAVIAYLKNNGNWFFGSNYNGDSVYRGAFEGVIKSYGHVNDGSLDLISTTNGYIHFTPQSIINVPSSGYNIADSSGLVLTRADGYRRMLSWAGISANSKYNFPTSITADTLVTNTASQTLTNKTLPLANNNITATSAGIPFIGPTNTMTVDAGFYWDATKRTVVINKNASSSAPSFSSVNQGFYMDGADGAGLTSTLDGFQTAPAIHLRSTGGTGASRSALTGAGTAAGSYAVDAYDGTAYSNPGVMWQGTISEDQGSSAHGMYWIGKTTSAGSANAGNWVTIGKNKGDFNLKVGGTEPVSDASAVFNIAANDRGILIPRLTTTQRNAISSPTTSLLIFNSTTGQYEWYNGSAWVGLASLDNPTFTTAITTPILKNNTSGTVVSASTSGTVTFKMIGQGTGDKTVRIYFNAATGTASYTFPIAFSHTPSVSATNDVAASVVTSRSTTAITVTGSGTTGYLDIIGD